jgi:hypothetical protein
MRPISKRTTAGAVLVVTVAVAALIVAIGAVANAKSTRHVKTVALLSLSRGSFEISLGDPPQWLPLSGTPQTLTLLAGSPTRPGYALANAYVGFVSAKAGCAATPADSGVSYTTLNHYFSSAHTGAHAGMFAPNGGAVASSYIASVPNVVIHQSGSVRACVWVASNIGATQTIQVITRVKVITKGKKGKKVKKFKQVITYRQQRAPRSLATSLLLPLLNRTFAASVSNLSGATPGSGGFTMYAIDGAHPFRYKVATLQCSRSSADGAATIAPGTPASESISISASPCSTDASTFTFSGADIRRALSFPIADALTSPALTVRLGGCELDPLTGATLTAAEQYLSADGCKLGQIEVSPYEKSLVRGSVAWAAIDGGVAELAPTGTTVDLVLNGNPS